MSDHVGEGSSATSDDPTSASNPDGGAHLALPRDLSRSQRVVFVGRTGSGKTTLARHVAALLGYPHVELDSLHFRDDLTTVPLDMLRARTAEAVSGDRWVVDGNKSSVRDLVWPRADTIVWLDYPLVVSLWRLGRRAASRTARVTRGGTPSASDGASRETWRVPKHLLAAVRGVIRALRSHAGQRRRYPVMFASPEYAHLEVVRLRSPGSAASWVSTVRTAAAAIESPLTGD